MNLISIRKAVMCFLVASAGVSLAWSMVTVDDPLPIEPIAKKKCVPAVETGPAASCPPGECRPAATCTMLEIEGSWTVGGCQTGGTYCENVSTPGVKNPMVKCQPVGCQISPGVNGFKCGWVGTGKSGTTTSTVESCNG